MTGDRPRAAIADSLRRIRWAARRVLRKTTRIVVETRWRLGDEIMAIPVYEGLKRRYPFSRLTAWCNHPDLLWRNPYVDEILGPNDSPPACDRFILLRGAPRQVRRWEHYAARAGISIPAELPRLFYDDWSCDVLSQHGLHEKEFVAVCTGATWEIKRWNVESWQSLCDALTNENRSVIQVGRNDQALRVSHDFLNRTSIREIACVLRAARLLIAHDTGLMHLALAVGTPVLALFGPTDATFLVRDTQLLSVITNGRPCQGCWNRSTGSVSEGVCPLKIQNCMDAINVDSVLERARELLADAR